MAEEHRPHPTPEEREDDRLLDIWLFTLFALGVLIFALFTAPRGCGDALREQTPQMKKETRSGQTAPAGARTMELRPSDIPSK